MTQVHPRFVHQFFVSLAKFDSSMARVMGKTFEHVNFDRDEALTPTYIAINVDYQPNMELQKAIRSFFQKLRGVHQMHHVRFVTDTMWAMESNNDDIFYTCDGDKDNRCDVIWQIKVVNDKQVELKLLLPQDNTRREIITQLEESSLNSFVTNPNFPVRDQLKDIVGCFYNSTRNIKLLNELQEDAHFVLVSASTGDAFYPCLIIGMAPKDARCRFNKIKSGLTYLKHHQPDYYTSNLNVPYLTSMAVDSICINAEDSEGFDNRTHYESIEQALAIADATSNVFRTKHDVFIIHNDKRREEINSIRYSTQYLQSAC